MTSAISRAANAAHAHGFAKSARHETPAAEGFEALFAAAANPLTTPSTSPSGGEPGKPGERAREDEKQRPATAFELAAAIAIAAVDAAKRDTRVEPKAVAVDADIAPAVKLPTRSAVGATMEFVVRDALPAPAFVPPAPPPKAEAKSEPIEAPQAQASRAEMQLPKSAANPLPVKAAPMPRVETEIAAPHAHETHAREPQHAEPIEPAKPAARPRVEFSPRALAQAAIVEAMRSPGRGRSQAAGEGESRTANVAQPMPPTNALPTAAALPAAAPPVTEAMTLAADAAPSLAKPITVSPASSKPSASSRAAADILHQRQYALGTDASPAGDVVPESAASFDTLIALRKADVAFDAQASTGAESEPAAPVGAGTWLPNLPAAAASATTAANAIVAPRVFDQTAWSAALAQQVTASALAAAKETTVRVEPEGLGPIEVRVRVSSEHVDVRFAIEHPVTLNMVRAALPDLEKMLAQSGLQLGDAQIAQQNAGHGEHAMPHRNASSNSRDDAEPAVVAAAVESRPRARVGLLDDFV